MRGIAANRQLMSAKGQSRRFVDGRGTSAVRSFSDISVCRLCDRSGDERHRVRNGDSPASASNNRRRRLDERRVEGHAAALHSDLPFRLSVAHGRTAIRRNYREVRRGAKISASRRNAVYRPKVGRMSCCISSAGGICCGVTNAFRIVLDSASVRRAAAEGVSETVIAAVLLLHEQSASEIASKLNASELEHVIRLVGRCPSCYPPGTLDALKGRRQAPPPPVPSAPTVSVASRQPATRTKPSPEDTRRAKESRLARLHAHASRTAPEPERVG